MLSQNISRPMRTFNYRTIQGPSFLNGIPEAAEWADFKEKILCDKSKSLSELWFEKVIESGGIPDRKDFAVEEFIKFGTNIFIGKLTDDGKWLTTYCGSGIADSVGLDASNKTFEDYAKPKTQKFWEDNLKMLTDDGKVYLEYYSFEYDNHEIKHCAAINLPLYSDGSPFPNVNLSYESFNREDLYPSD
ncbi:hypothetical protein [Pseudemcibacter aquimaris]|uniref:hypothetical protein n=1 Tax=Pseudemcibacter aquimaris TaxID=2857064 RepID=UPI0020131A78|nr:hypothetical protein [Pseudemcibacter aquimaris]MCC3860948.1 hypothetical protein [Pseudemcibacter aquimaris]WDU59766.1 hypothetical protein KW060_05795 [Pseudemcibacter aquimaris]